MHLIQSAPTRSARRIALVATTALALAAPVALAQAPQPIAPAPAQPKQPQQPQKQPAAKQPQKQQPAKAPQPQQPAQQQPAQQPAPAGQQPPAAPTQELSLMYSPWIKICNKDAPQPAKLICMTVKEARTDTGVFLSAVQLYETEGDQKLLRLTLPFGMLLAPGTRVFIDKDDQAVTAPYVLCVQNGCWSDYQVNADFVAKMKKGQMLVLQAINIQNQQQSFPIPLADFAKANEGPPTDPKELELKQKQLQDELQKKADEQRQKLLGAPPANGTPPAAQPK